MSPTFFQSLQSIAAVIGALTVILTPLFWAYRHVFVRFLAAPIAEKLYEQLEDIVENIVMGDGMQEALKDMVEQIVVAESSHVIRELGKLERQVTQIRIKLAE